MKIELLYKLDRLNTSCLHVDIIDHEFNTIVSIPTDIENNTEENNVTDYVEKYVVYKNLNMFYSDFIQQVLKENLLLNFSKYDVIDLDDLQPGYINKYRLPFYYQDDEQVVSEGHFKTWLKLQQDNVLILSPRLAYYLGEL